jgi:hypothetical protein
MPITYLRPAWVDTEDAELRKKVKKRIDAYKRRLKAKVARYGMFENLGNKEIRALSDEFGIIQSDPVVREMMESFTDWCWNYVPPRGA